jgi:hypothetical protein
MDGRNMTQLKSGEPKRCQEPNGVSLDDFCNRLFSSEDEVWRSSRRDSSDDSRTEMFGE